MTPGGWYFLPYTVILIFMKCFCCYVKVGSNMSGMTSVLAPEDDDVVMPLTDRTTHSRISVQSAASSLPVIHNKDLSQVHH